MLTNATTVDKKRSIGQQNDRPNCAETKLQAYLF